MIRFDCANNCGISADIEQTYRVIIPSYAEVNCISPLALNLHIVISL